MRVLIVEDDDLMADLLETVVAGLHPALRIFQAPGVSDAHRLRESQSLELYIIDWTLPDGSGLALLRDIRAVDKQVPVVMITARADRESILKAAHYGISGYISKPFDVEMLHNRLLGMIGDKLPPATSNRTLAEHLSEGLESGIHVSGRLDVGGILSLLERASDISGGQLADRWQKEVALCARLLEVANRSSFRRTGEPVSSVRDAISVMGVPMALSQALAMALNVASDFTTDSLRDCAARFQSQAEAVAAEAQKIALAMGKRGPEFQTAGLLSRVGELAVLKVVDQFMQDGGGSVGEDELETALKEWSQRYGNQLKVQWRLPLELRQMIGAVHALSRENVTQKHLVMRAAGLMAGPGDKHPDCSKIMRHLGLEEWYKNSVAEQARNEEQNNV